ncbi:MAG: glutathione transferase GstA [Alphaproteobacteria bacterium]|nr:MAG: glutathione transferase GstA [Alphaproteobacteria bacterium]
MKLYYATGACSLGPHIIIREAGLDAELDKVTFGAERTTESGKDFYTINPQGAVPVLETGDGETLTEAQVLLQYLASLAPAKNLMPTEGFAKWRALATLNFIATELHKGTSPLFRKPNDEARDAAHKLLQNRWGLFAQKLGDKDYVVGEFSVADAYAFTVLRWARQFKVDLSALPTLEAYFQRVQARPAVQQALTEEGLPTS